MDAVPKKERIPASDVPDFIRNNFGKVTGTLSCYNPHWWLHFYPDYVAYEYQCCDWDGCNSHDYEKYRSAESLITDHRSTLTDGDDWSWK
jgi:hypothetical protein